MGNTVEIKITGDARGLKAATDQAQSALKETGQSVQSLSQTITRMPGFGGIAASLGTLASAGAIKALLSDTIAWAAGMDDLAEKTGASVENLSGLYRVATISGTSMGTVETALIRLSKALAGVDEESKGAGHALAYLGLNAAELREMDSAKALEVVADAMSKYGDGTGKTALALGLFGREGAQFLPLLKDLAEEHLRAGQLTTEQAAAAEMLEKAWGRTRLEGSDWAKQIAVDLIPTLASLLDFVSETKIGIYQVGSSLAVVANDISTFAQVAGAAIGGGFTQEGQDHIKELLVARGRFVEAANEDMVKRLSEFKSLRDRIDAVLAGSSEQKPKAKYTNRDPKDAGADKEAAALDQLRQQLIGATGNFAELDKVTDRITNGPWKDFSQATKNIALSLAGQIDAMKKDIELRKEREQVSGEMVKQDGRVAEQIDASRLALHNWLEELEFESSLIGKSAGERARAQDVRRIDIQLGKDLLAVQKELANRTDSDGINTDLDAASADLQKTADERRAALMKRHGEDAARAGDWAAGASDALIKYRDTLGNVASFSEQAFTRAFSGMEDALVNFVRTGKLDFKSLADSIISDLIRIQIRQSIMKPFADAGGLGGLLGGLFSPSSTPAPSQGFGMAGDAGTLLGFAGGGDHTGGWRVVGERGPEIEATGPARIFNAQQTREILSGNSGNGGMQPVRVEVINPPGRPAEVEKATARFDIEGMVVSIFLRDITQGGRIANTIQNQYGLNRAAGSVR